MTLPLVSVCVCTYQRPKMLYDLLSSLAVQRAEKFEIEVIVVDNDDAKSAECTVLDFSSSVAPMRVIYDVEPEQGISFARNRTVQLARGDFVAFIDDDESAEPEWLHCLYEMMVRADCDVVLGPVVPVFPDGTPSWVVASRFFERPRHLSGARVQSPEGRTSNALVRRTWLARGPVFDVRFARTGGEDHEFFWRIEEQGAILRWCDEAVVRELVLRERQMPTAILERSLRSSMTYWRIHGPQRRRPLQTIIEVILGLSTGAVLAVAGLLAWPAGRGRAISLWAKAASGFGRALAVTPLRLYGYTKKSMENFLP